MAVIAVCVSEPTSVPSWLLLTSIVPARSNPAAVVAIKISGLVPWPRSVPPAATEKLVAAITQ